MRISYDFMTHTLHKIISTAVINNKYIWDSPLNRSNDLQGLFQDFATRPLGGVWTIMAANILSVM